MSHSEDGSERAAAEEERLAKLREERDAMPILYRDGAAWPPAHKFAWIDVDFLLQQIDAARATIRDQQAEIEAQAQHHEAHVERLVAEIERLRAELVPIRAARERERAMLGDPRKGLHIPPADWGVPQNASPPSAPANVGDLAPMVPSAEERLDGEPATIVRMANCPERRLFLDTGVIALQERAYRDGYAARAANVGGQLGGKNEQ